MNLHQARSAARQWVADEAAGLPGFQGAFLTGSAIWLPGTATFPPTSDVDITLVYDRPGESGSDLPEDPGKFRYGDVVLEASWIAARDLRSPDLMLGNYHLAGSFRSPDHILADPAGALGELVPVVSRDYANRFWVARRVDHAMGKITRGLESLNAAAPVHEQVLSWVFPTGVTTHVLLLAGLRNATVRQRYVAVRELLAEYDRLDLHDELLDLLGCARMSPARAGHHLDALITVFDAVKDRARSPFPFAADISEVGRPIAIDGSRDLIARGYHREAVFWIVVTYSRCLAVLHADVPDLSADAFEDGYRALLGDLGIGPAGDLERRRNRLEALLPRLQKVADEIMSSNPDIQP